MLRIEIREKACRGCELCIDTCPTDVLSLDQSNRKSRVDCVENCIACLIRSSTASNSNLYSASIHDMC